MSFASGLPALMPTPTILLLFALATLAQTASPGPGVLYVMARSLSQGRRAGLASMFGIESGEVVWMVAAGTGLTALLAASAPALNVLRFAGAGYLVWLGVQRWRYAGRLETPRPASAARLYAQGVLTQLVNPKVAVVFIAFFPPFLDVSRPLAPQVAALGVVYMAVAVAVDSTYVLAASALARRLLRSRRAQRTANRVAAGSYLGLGVAAAASAARNL